MPIKIFGDIISPCTANWDSMPGTDQVRYCAQCNLNVHNLTSMTDEDALAAMERTKGSRFCARIRKRPDGSLYTDNCPYPMRRLRNIIRRTAPWAFVFCAFLFNQTIADAQGLTGAPVDPRFGISGEITPYPMGDYGYNTARDISRVVTALSTIPSAILGLRYYLKRTRLRWPRYAGCAEHQITNHPLLVQRRYSWRALFIALLIAQSIPTIIHLIGTFAINNADGLAWAGE